MDLPEPTFDTSGPHVVSWQHEYVRQTKGRWAGEPLDLEPWQIDFTYELFRLDAEGRRVYTEGLLEVPRKNGKSTVASGLGLYLLAADGEASPEVYCAAGAKEQAGAVHRQAKATVLKSPLVDYLDVLQYHIACPANDGLFRVIPSNAQLQHGSNPSGSLIDELWAHKTLDLYTALTTGTGAREEPLTVTITTVGEDRDSPLGLVEGEVLARGRDVEQRAREREDGYELIDGEGLNVLARGPGIEYEVRDDGFLTIVRDFENGFLFWGYGPPIEPETGRPLVDLEDPEVWAKCNPASWIAPRYLKRQRNKPSARLADFQRFHLNYWAEAADYWLGEGAWASCRRDPEHSRLVEGAPTYGAADLGLKRDRAALVLVQGTGEFVEIDQGEGEAPELVERYRTDALIFNPPKEGSFDKGELRAAIREASRRFDLREVAYDPWRMDDSAEQLLDEGINMVEFPQSDERMCPASELAFEAINAERVIHDGDPEFAAHVNAGAITDKGERGWRLTKRKATKPIDALIALVMALSHAVANEGSSVYEERGLLVLGGAEDDDD